MHLTSEQRLQRLEARLTELDFWRWRSYIDLTSWSFDGDALALGASWPRIEGVRTLAHDTVLVPDDWDLNHVRLELDLGGEGLLQIVYDGRRRESFGR